MSLRSDANSPVVAATAATIEMLRYSSFPRHQTDTYQYANLASQMERNKQTTCSKRPADSAFPAIISACIFFLFSVMRYFLIDSDRHRLLLSTNFVHSGMLLEVDQSHFQAVPSNLLYFCNIAIIYYHFQLWYFSNNVSITHWLYCCLLFLGDYCHYLLLLSTNFITEKCYSIG